MCVHIAKSEIEIFKVILLLFKYLFAFALILNLLIQPYYVYAEFSIDLLTTLLAAIDD